MGLGGTHLAFSHQPGSSAAKPKDYIIVKVRGPKHDQNRNESCEQTTLSSMVTERTFEADISS